MAFMAKKIAVINDLSGFGKCSLTAAIPVLSVMGLQPCPLPTAILSAQTGYPSYYCDDYTDRMENFRIEWEKMKVHFDGIYTGFVASEQQIRTIFRFLDTFYREDTFLLVDPVMGDDGDVYDMFTEELCRLMKQLVEKADIVTPNLTELCLLADTDYEQISGINDKDKLLESVTQMAKNMINKDDKIIIVTGIHYKEDGVAMMGNLAVTREEVVLSGVPKLGGSYSGTGDLFASVVTGGIARGDKLNGILKEAGAFLSASMEASPDTDGYNPDGVEFEQCLGMLLKK